MNTSVTVLNHSIPHAVAVAGTLHTPARRLHTGWRSRCGMWLRSVPGFIVIQHPETADALVEAGYLEPCSGCAAAVMNLHDPLDSTTGSTADRADDDLPDVDMSDDVAA